jgi:hypothetical protein
MAGKVADMEILVEIAYFVVSVTGNVTVIVHRHNSTRFNKLQEGIRLVLQLRIDHDNLLNGAAIQYFRRACFC